MGPVEVLNWDGQLKEQQQEQLFTDFLTTITQIAPNIVKRTNHQ